MEGKKFKAKLTRHKLLNSVEQRRTGPGEIVTATENFTLEYFGHPGEVVIQDQRRSAHLQLGGGACA